MFDEVRKHLNEVIELSDTCPEKYQIKCFEVLLNALAGSMVVAAPSASAAPVTKAQASKDSKYSFFTDHGILEEHWTKVFEWDGNSCSIIVKSLGGKSKAGNQCTLALLVGIKSLLETGEANIPKSVLIDLCKEYSAHDQTNFAANMKKHKGWFLGKGPEAWKLTKPGQEKAADIIKAL